MTGGILAFSFPNPFSLLGDVLSPLLGLPSALAGSIVREVLEDLASAMVGALVDLAASIMGFFWTAAEPKLQSSWFHGTPDASYDQMVTLAAPLLVTFFLLGVIQGVMKGDRAGMLRMAAIRLPGAVLAMSVTVALGDLLLDITDDMSAVLLAGFRDDIEQVGVLLEAARLGGGMPGMMLELVFAGVGLLAAAALVIELFVRAALIYLLAAFSPLIYAASVWETMRGSTRKLFEIALALIVSKLAIAVALAVASSALVAAWPEVPEPTSLITPEQTAAQMDQPLAQTFGVLVAAVVMFCVAAFMPFVLWRLLPLAEGASAAQGVRGAPLRAAYTASSVGMMAMNNPATAVLRGKGQGKSAAAGSAGGSATAAKAAGGPATVAVAAAGKAVSSTKRRAANAAANQAGGLQSPSGAGGRGSSNGSRSPAGTGPGTGGGGGQGPAGGGQQRSQQSQRPGGATSRPQGGTSRPGGGGRA